MIIVTGGAGFIGSNLINELCKKYKNIVVCDFKAVVRKEYFNNFNQIKEFIEPSELENFILSFWTNLPCSLKVVLFPK